MLATESRCLSGTLLHQAEVTIADSAAAWPAAIDRVRHASAATRTAPGAPARRSAGGIVVRATAAGREVLLVWRARRGDWSFPRGGVAAAEPASLAAVREVAEETGLACSVTAALPVVRWQNEGGCWRELHYFTMAETAGTAAACAEIDAVAWVTLEDALTRVSHARDRAIVEQLLAVG